MAVHTFLKSLFTSLGGANVDARVLRTTIEANGIIIIDLMDGPNALRWADEAADPLYSFAFDSTLPGPQLTELGVIVAAHTGPDASQVSSSRTFLRAVDPLLTDDETSVEAFRVGDSWINTVLNTAFVLVDADVGDAIWEWNTFAGDLRDADADATLSLIDPNPHTGGQILRSVAAGGSELADPEDLVVTVATSNYTPGGLGTIEDHLVAIDSELGSVDAHASAHENGGGDEISVAGLSGVLADDQNPVNHAADHANGGGDELNVGGLSGQLADDQPPLDHASDHSDGGSDEITVENLATASTTTTEVLSPDGVGGLVMRAEAAGPVFGTELAIAESTAVSTMTSETFQQKVRLPVAGDITFPAGTYLLGISYGWNHDSTNNDFEAEVRQNDVVIGQIHQQEPQDVNGTFASTGTDQKHYLTREFHVVLGAGDFHFDLRFRTNNAGDESSMWDAYMRIWRLV